MRRRFHLCFFVCVFLVSKLPQKAEAQSYGEETHYLLPRTIFVGDEGRLVVPLGQAFADAEPFILEPPELPPETSALVIKRVELSRGTGAARLTIDFVPYITGAVVFPDITLSSNGTEPLIISGLKAEVASILDPSQMSLAESASPMTVPGTTFLIYGTAAIVLILLAGGIGGSVWGRRHFGGLREKLHRKFLLRGMTGFLRRLGEAFEKNGNPEYYLTLLAAELRNFLSLFTGINCRSFTAAEFYTLPDACVRAAKNGIAYNAEGGGDSALPEKAFLGELFGSWDTLRFSGRAVKKNDVVSAVNKTASFIAALDMAERQKGGAKEKPPSTEIAEAGYGV